MIGKKNIVFGFLYLVLTASLGPYMVANMLPDVDAALADKQAPVGRLQQLQENDFEEDLDALPADKIAMANTAGILALNKMTNTQGPLNAMRSAHAHGNLEAVLNILAGLTLGFIAIGRLFKQIISWAFIIGALTHSGMLYLLNFGQTWASSVLQLGPWIVLTALLLIGVAAAIGLKSEVVKDNRT